MWRRRMNHELYQVYKDADIVKRIKHGRLQWTGHVARMPEEVDPAPVECVLSMRKPEQRVLGETGERHPKTD